MVWTRRAYSSASPNVNVFSPRRSTVASKPSCQSDVMRATASAVSVPPMNWRPIRRIPARATAVASRAPPGSQSATSSPARTTAGLSTVRTYSSRCSSTSRDEVHAGNASTNRNRPVLKCGRWVAHARSRVFTSSASRRRGLASRRIRRARSCTSPSAGTMLRIPGQSRSMPRRGTRSLVGMWCGRGRGARSRGRAPGVQG